MGRFRYKILFIIALLVLAGCGKRGESFDPLLRARVDGLNKKAFMKRYQDPALALSYGYASLSLIGDSLPGYDDGRLRAWNSMAFNYFILGDRDSAYAYVDSVSLYRGDAVNRDVEQLIASLLRARLEQINCLIANSYQILYDIDRSKVLDRREDNFLYDYALMEYYITSLALNYHFRNGAVDNLNELLEEIEEERGNLRCDYSEDMALNYALAHAYYRLSAADNGNEELLRKSLGYLDDNLAILKRPGAYCEYHLANVYQLQAFITAEPKIAPGGDLACYDSVAFGLDRFAVSTALFFRTPDPYQHLGAVVSAADYCMLVGDTALAWDYYTMAIEDSTWTDGFAPKFEAMFYRGLMASGYSDDKSLNQGWLSKELDILEYIKQNERADFLLQNQLAKARGINKVYVISIIGILFLLLLISALAFQLRRLTKHLRAETVRLQQAKQKDVERIANVETCLSVLRHDITPFVSYLQNKNLPEELKEEVLGQLVRTFQNIKSWTSLSIPSGLQFRESEVSLQEVFDSVSESVPNFRGDGLRVVFVPNSCRVRGDRQLLEIMLRNLVKNAVQYTEEGCVTVEAALDKDDVRFVHITVADTGRGMSAEDVENVFRADKKIKHPEAGAEGYGSGFGLILCRYIVKKHDDNTLRGCRIWVESELGKGSTFHIVLAKSEEK